MWKYLVQYRTVVLAGCAMGAAALSAFLPQNILADEVTTTLQISVCGDGIVQSLEVCDDGAGNNTGGYATSTAGRVCLEDCSGYGPYCGDAILQPLYSESCDEGDNDSGGTCSVMCTENPRDDDEDEADGPTSSGGGGASFEGNGTILRDIPTRVKVQGTAYPSADVHILKDGEEFGIVAADSFADFVFSSDAVTPGTATFSIWAADTEGTKSLTLSSTFEVVESATTIISGMLLPPTLRLGEKSILHGEPLAVLGASVPFGTVQLDIFGQTAGDERAATASSSAEGSGLWEYELETNTLSDEQLYFAKAKFSRLVSASNTTQESGYGKSVSFYVGDQPLSDVISSDINGDERVNLIDFSIMLFYWGGDDIRADLNQDKKVNLTDFSILLFNWTG